MPIELRPLWNYVRDIGDPVKQHTSRGTLELWLEMLDINDAADIPPTELRDPSPVEVEIRLVIWAVRALKPNVGSSKKYVDAMVRVALDCATYEGRQPTSQTTDVHYSASDTATFNWRVVFSNIQTPSAVCVAQISLLDFNSVGAPTFLGEVNLDLDKYVDRVAAELTALKADAELKITNVSAPNPNEAQAYVQLSLEVLSQPEANSSRVGLGREKPNRGPRLLTPTEGRGWDDYLKGLDFGLGAFLREVWLRLRVVLVLLFTALLIVILIVYPALVYQ
ncbi:unnamed protein product [Vitrella brassicaformis CCMP3155]|uniref:C2 domain-containing protein n=1 Tax=Vitrella brassicaformis (strain CCMP3155) TaxID=1169540 RepID=A0A0G4G2V3_VITBC|nr:unnamed protein product [Vitrella brassicaformis CCMP3155]|eukprot:CEM22522.1 unnamed protein product [Vitrella brassicaformis CCMP3155]